MAALNSIPMKVSRQSKFWALGRVGKIDPERIAMKSWQVHGRKDIVLERRERMLYAEVSAESSVLSRLQPPHFFLPNSLTLLGTISSANSSRSSNYCFEIIWRSSNAGYRLISDHDVLRNTRYYSELVEADERHWPSAFQTTSRRLI